MLNLKFKSLVELQTKLSSENKCFNYLVKIRWDGKPICVYCNHNKVCIVKDKDFKCSKCNRRFTIKTGTIMEGSKLSLKKWLMAIYFVTNDKKGVSSYQLADNLGITQKTAWFVLHRLKHLITVKGNVENKKLRGTVEIDEVYIGGKSENKHMHQRIALKEKDNKAIVVGMVQRGGDVKAVHVNKATSVELIYQINNNVEEGSNVFTDEYKSYHSIGREYNHRRVNHSKGEYVVKAEAETRNLGKVAYKIHTNTIEGFWSIVKRTINGTHHWISKKHLQKYINEMSYRYGHRHFTMAEKFEGIALHLEARLRYKELIA